MSTNFKRGVMSQLHLRGWDTIEPQVLCALIADIPIMFTGTHGECKTDACKAISLSLLGSDAVFHDYDYGRTNKDELMGVLNPNDMLKEKLSYIPGPTTVWGADAVLMDEFSRANVMLGSLVHSLLIKKTMMGLKTNVKLAFAAANPPEVDGVVYETNFIDLATASRFCMVEVPGPNDIGAKDFERIALSEDDMFDNPPPVLKDLVKRARNVEFGKKSIVEIARTARELSEQLNSFKGIQFSTRQGKYLTRLMLAAERLKALGYTLDDNDLAGIVQTLVPEVSGMVATIEEVDGNQVDMKIKSIIVGMVIGDPILSGATLSEILQGDRDDLMGWAGAVCMLAEKAEAQELLDAISVLKELRTDLSHRKDIFNTMFHTVFLRYLERSSDIKEPLPSTMAKRVISISTITKLIQEI